MLEAVHENSLPFINGGEPIEAVPEIPIWLSLAVILGVLVIATVASLLKTRGQLAPAEGTGVDPEGQPTGEPGEHSASLEAENRAARARSED